jgi:hypothetical protein
MIWKPSDAMNRINKALVGGMGIYPGVVIVIAILLAASTVQSQAQIYDISSQNSSLQVDLSGANAGLSDWTVNGVNQLEQQWFYYSIGSGPVESINTLAPWSTPVLGGNAAFGVMLNTNLSETYASSALSVQTTVKLVGGSSGSGSSTLDTSIVINNLTGTNETLHFYQYSDFGLGGVTGGQNVQFAGTIFPYSVTQTGLGGPLVGSITSVSGGLSDSVEEIAGIVDGNQFGLKNGNSAPAFGGPLSAGTGDVDYAYEIDVNLAASGAGSAVTIGEIQAVPEPSSITLILLGMIALALSMRNRLIFFKK